MTGAADRAGHVYHFGATDVTPVFFVLLQLILQVLYFCVYSLSSVFYCNCVVFWYQHCVCRSSLFPFFIFWACHWILMSLNWHFVLMLRNICRYMISACTSQRDEIHDEVEGCQIHHNKIE